MRPASAHRRGECARRGHENQPFNLRLRHQKPVEGIAVMHGEIPCLLRVPEGQRQMRESAILDHRSQIVPER